VSRAKTGRTVIGAALLAAAWLLAACSIDTTPSNRPLNDNDDSSEESATRPNRPGAGD